MKSKNTLCGCTPDRVFKHTHCFSDGSPAYGKKVCYTCGWTSRFDCAYLMEAPPGMYWKHECMGEGKWPLEDLT